MRIVVHHNGRIAAYSGEPLAWEESADVGLFADLDTNTFGEVPWNTILDLRLRFDEVVQRDGDKNGWMKVSDHPLPQRDDEQLLAWPLLSEGWGDTQVGSCSAAFARQHGATHWQHLPSAPQGDEL